MSEDLRTYLSLLDRLHEAMETDNEEEADRIRDQMDAPGERLTLFETHFARTYSTILYSESGMIARWKRRQGGRS